MEIKTIKNKYHDFIYINNLDHLKSKHKKNINNSINIYAKLDGDLNCENNPFIKSLSKYNEINN